MTVKTVKSETTFRASDGTEFENKQKAEGYEKLSNARHEFEVTGYRIHWTGGDGEHRPRNVLEFRKAA